MKKLILILSIAIFSVSLFAQETVPFGTQEKNVEYYFGFRIVPTYGGVVQYCIVYSPNGKDIEEAQAISKATFFEEIQGKEWSLANPDTTNILAKRDIKKETFDNIWKLRYREYPLGGRDSTNNTGWSSHINNYVPANAQMDILKQYGVEQINGTFWGENAFRLLKDMEDKAWVRAYREAKDDPNEGNP